MKVTEKETPYESRGCLDGKVLFLVLARTDLCDEIEDFIKQKKWHDLLKLIVENFVEMVDKSVPEKVNFNLSEIKQ